MKKLRLLKTDEEITTITGSDHSEEEIVEEEVEEIIEEVIEEVSDTPVEEVEVTKVTETEVAIEVPLEETPEDVETPKKP